MKIKTEPNDFIVEEILGAEPLKKGTHHLYLLTKINMNTTEAVDAISRAWKIPAYKIAYGGRKDRHARACQHITIASAKPLPQTFKEEGYAIREMGYLDRPMGPDLILANRFGVTARDLSAEDLSRIRHELPKVQETGYANYFDDQRFGSFDKRMGFFAEKLLKKHENGALKIFLTQTSGSDKKNERDRKAKIWESWGDWDACLKLSRSEFETA